MFSQIQLFVRALNVNGFDVSLIKLGDLLNSLEPLYEKPEHFILFKLNMSLKSMIPVKLER